MRKFVILTVAALCCAAAAADAIAQTRSCTNTCTKVGNSRTCTKTCS